MSRAVGFVLLSLSFFACAPSVKFVRRAAAPVRPAAVGPVYVFLDGRSTTGLGEELGTLEIIGGDLETRIEQARGAARLQGGNMVVLLNVSPEEAEEWKRLRVGGPRKAGQKSIDRSGENVMRPSNVALGRRRRMTGAKIEIDNFRVLYCARECPVGE